MDMADHMVQDGFLDAGYEYVNIDVRHCIIILYCSYIMDFGISGLLGIARERCGRKTPS